MSLKRVFVLCRPSVCKFSTADIPGFILNSGSLIAMTHYASTTFLFISVYKFKRLNCILKGFVFEKKRDWFFRTFKHLQNSSDVLLKLTFSAINHNHGSPCCAPLWNCKANVPPKKCQTMKTVLAISHFMK